MHTVENDILGCSNNISAVPSNLPHKNCVDALGVWTTGKSENLPCIAVFKKKRINC